MSKNSVSNIPEEYKPISMWGYFGYNILFSLPIIGLICLLCFAFGAKNVNLKNFSRSFLCSFILAAIIIFLIVLVVGVGAFAEALKVLR